MSLIQELKRRNVFRIGAAYAVVAWLLLQFADVILNNVEAPPWVFHTILLLLGIGFLLAVAFAWAFELTPEGIKRENEVDRTQSITSQTGRKLDRMIIVVLALALGYFVYDKFSPASQGLGDSGPLTRQAGTATQEGRKSIAVLPFANMSGDPANEPFTLGIHDDLLTHLSRISALKTISRTSVLQYKGTTKTIPQIAAELGVAHVLEGGIQRSGDRVRINLQLIDAVTDEHLWAEIYDRELSAENLFAVQGEIATAVTQSLRATLLPEEETALQVKPTNSMAAYDLYLLGRHHWNQRTAESIELARDYFARAIEEDPNYVLALSGLADSYSLLVLYGNMQASEAHPLAEEALERAMALDDSRSEVWASRGLLLLNQDRYPESAAALDKALQIDEQNFSAWLWYGNTMLMMRRYEDHLAALQKAYSLEPMSKPVNINISSAYNVRGDFAQSRLHYERIDEIDELDITQYRVQIARTWFWSGEIARAIEELRRVVAVDPQNVEAMMALRDNYLFLGDHAEAGYWAEQHARLDSLAPPDYDVLLARGQYEDAIVYLEDKMLLQENPNNLYMLFMAFQAAYLGDNIETADAYLAKYLGILGGRREVNPGDSWQSWTLLLASFLIEHGDAGTGEAMRDEALAGLTNLNAQGFKHPATYFGMAQARALSGDRAGAMDALEQAVARGYRDLHGIRTDPALKSLRGDAQFVALSERLESLLAEQRQRLDQLALEPFTPFEGQEEVTLTREQLERVTGYYTDDNVVIRVYLDERGQLIARGGQDRPMALAASSEDEFFPRGASAFSVKAESDEQGRVTHMLLSAGGELVRYKVTDPPPPALQVSRSTLERYEGIYSALRRQGQAETADTDIWTGQVSIDDEGRVWLDLDDQSAKEIVPYSENEFYMVGFTARFRFEVDEGQEQASRMVSSSGSTELVFERQSP